MEPLIEFFENISTLSRAGILISGIFIFWIAEGVIPLFEFQYEKIRHAGVNLFFTFLTAVIGFGLAGVLYGVSTYVTAAEFGLIYLFDMPLWLQVILGVMMLDLIGAYFAHWTEHKIKWMWKFHLIHHSDMTVDVTTGLRHHPGETLIRISFTIFAVAIIGAPIGVIMLYQSLSVVFAHITHANIRMPVKIDRMLSFIFITPLMHKIHHHYKQPLTDTNYGNIFAIWDRIFGTFAEVDDVKTLRYGIDTHMDPAESDEMGNLLKMPFQEYRPSTESKFGKAEEKKKRERAGNS